MVKSHFYRFFGFFYFSVLLLFFMTYRSSIGERFYYDQLILDDMINSGEAVLTIGGSYLSTAYVYSLLPSFLRNEYFLSSLFVFVSIVFLSRLSSFWAILLHLISGTFLIVYLGQVSKDLIVYISVVAITFVPPSKHKIFVFIWYAFYSTFFRWYYIFAFWGRYLLGAFFRFNWFSRLFLLCLIIFILPDSIYEGIYKARMEVNEFRLASDVRTIIFSPFSGYDFFSTVGNYFYSIFLMLFPFSFGLAIQDFMVFFINILIFHMSFLVYKSRLTLMTEKEETIYFLFLGHFLLLFLFEPDLGSYLRHLLTYSPLLIYCYDKVSVRIVGI